LEGDNDKEGDCDVVNNGFFTPSPHKRTGGVKDEAESDAMDVFG
jgi:hypothetical protein